METVSLDGAVRHALCDSSCRPQGPPKRDRPDQADDLQGRISKSCRKSQGSPSQVLCSGPKMQGRKPCREEDYHRQSRKIPCRLGTTDYGRGGPQKATVCRLPFLLGPYVVARAIPWLGRRRCLRTRVTRCHLSHAPEFSASLSSLSTVALGPPTSSMLMRRWAAWLYGAQSAGGYARGGGVGRIGRRPTWPPFSSAPSNDASGGILSNEVSGGGVVEGLGFGMGFAWGAVWPRCLPLGCSPSGCSSVGCSPSGCGSMWSLWSSWTPSSYSPSSLTSSTFVKAAAPPEPPAGDPWAGSAGLRGAGRLRGRRGHWSHKPLPQCGQNCQLQPDLDSDLCWRNARDPEGRAGAWHVFHAFWHGRYRDPGPRVQNV